MKKRILLLILIAIIFIVSGCDSSITELLPTIKPVVEATPPPVINDISMMYASNLDMSSDAKLLDAIQHIININVRIDTYDTNDYNRKLTIKLADGTDYDAINIDPNFAIAYKDNFTDIGGIVGDYGNYNAWLGTNYSYDDLYAFPTSINTREVETGWFIGEGVDASSAVLTVAGGVDELLYCTAPLFGINSTIQKVEGKPTFMPITEQYKDLYTWLHELYAGGRLDKDFEVLRQADWQYRLDNNIIELTAVGFDNWSDAIDAGYTMTDPIGDEDMVQKVMPGNHFPDRYIGIQAASSKTNLVLEYIDFMFSDMGSNVLNNGFSGPNLDWVKLDTYSIRGDGILSPLMSGVLTNELSGLPSDYDIASRYRKLSTNTMIDTPNLTGNEYERLLYVEGMLLPKLHQWQVYFIENGVKSEDWLTYKDELYDLDLNEYLALKSKE